MSRVPLKTRLHINAAAAITEAAQRSHGSFNRRLLSLFDVRAPPTPTPVDGVTSSDHIVDSTRNLKVRHFSPSSSSSSSSDPTIPVIVYFHGGGFVTNSAFSRPFDTFCRRFSRQIPAHVISVDYRLAPQHRHPAAYEDGIDVLRWLDSGDVISDLSAVFLAGDSAGGNVAHHVARMVLRSSFSRLSLIGLVGLQPFFGGEEDTESEKRLEGKVPFGSREQMKYLWRSFLPVGSDLNHEAANVFGPGSGSSSEDWSRFPATMVVVGGRDVLQDRQRWYYQGLKEAGVNVCLVEYPNACHAFYVFPELTEANQVIVEMAHFVKNQQLESEAKQQYN